MRTVNNIDYESMIEELTEANVIIPEETYQSMSEEEWGNYIIHLYDIMMCPTNNNPHWAREEHMTIIHQNGFMVRSLRIKNV